MVAESNKRIAVFFTHDVSLELWDKRGMFSREVRFYQELADRVGEVWLFTYGEHDDQYRDRLGANIRLFPKRCKCPASHYAFMIPFVYRKELRSCDAIRIHQVAGAIPALIAHWLYRKPLIVRAGFQWYSFTKHQGAWWLKLATISLIERLAYRAARAIIHTTQNDADFVAKRYNIAPDKIHVISNWVDIDLFKPFDVEKRPRSICYVGRLEEQKNLTMLIEALQGLDAKLMVYGEGSQRQHLAEQARRLNVDVDFRGRIANEDLPAALNACAIFVLPSLYEGNPKALLEAMACGLAAVGTNIRGINTIIKDGQTGLLCEPNAESIREALRRLLNDRELRDRLGAQARQHILKITSLDQAVQTELPFYA